VWMYECVDVSRRRSADWRERQVGRGTLDLVSKPHRWAGRSGVAQVPIGCGISSSINLSQPPEGRPGPYPPCGDGLRCDLLLGGEMVRSRAGAVRTGQIAREVN